MPKPLESESKVWGLVYVSDFYKLTAVAMFALLLAVGLTSAVGIGIGILVGFIVLGFFAVLAVVKCIMPTNFINNYMNYRKSPHSYWPTREPREYLNDDSH